MKKGKIIFRAATARIALCTGWKCSSRQAEYAKLILHDLGYRETSGLFEVDLVFTSSL